jgi:hypothetical protein
MTCTVCGWARRDSSKPRPTAAARSAYTSIYFHTLARLLAHEVMTMTMTMVEVVRSDCYGPHTRTVPSCDDETSMLVSGVGW